MKTYTGHFGSVRLSHSVVSGAATIIVLMMTLNTASPAQLGIIDTNTGWLPSVAIDPAAQHLWFRREIASLSNSVVALGFTFRQDLDPIHDAIRDLNAADHWLRASLEEEQALASERHLSVMDTLTRMEGLADTMQQDVQLVSWSMSDTVRQLSTGRTAVTSDIDRLDITVAALVLGFSAMTFILWFRNSRAGRAMNSKKCVATGSRPRLHESRVGAASMPRAVDLKPPAQLPPSAAGLPRQTIVPDGILAPKALLQRLIEEAMARREGDAMPAIGAETRTVSMAGAQGHVRHDNQDYHLCWEIGERSVAIVADGCGGMDHGAMAAYVAVREAASFLLQALEPTGVNDPVVSVRQAIVAASDGLAKCAAAAVPQIRDGLRTTLIVIVADAQRFAFAYIGDGGGVIVRKNGSIEKFLFPQKADADITNVLAASLGPDMEGEPASGVVPRYPGDLLVVGTDGVWDCVGAKFPLAVAQTVAKHGGDVHAAAESVIKDLANATDEQGYICSDNLTLGLISDPVRASMPPIRAPAASFPQTDNNSRAKEGHHDQT